MDTRRGLRRGFAVALVAVLVAAGCSGDDDAEQTTTTASDDTPSEEATPEESETSTTLSEEEFSEGMAAFSAQLEAAGDDMCAVLEVTNRAPPRPANPEQTEQVVELATEILRAYGASAPEAPELAAGFDQLADELVAEAAASGFDPEFLERQPAALSTEESIALQGQFGDLAEINCAPATDPGADGQP